jgi:flagellar biogenesis protein FliO
MFSSSISANRIRALVWILPLLLLGLPASAQQKSKKAAAPAVDGAQALQASGELAPATLPSSSVPEASSAPTVSEKPVSAWAKNAAARKKQEAAARMETAMRTESLAKSENAQPLQAVVPASQDRETVEAQEELQPASTIAEKPVDSRPSAPVAVSTSDLAAPAASGWLDLTKVVGSVGLTLTLLIGGFFAFRKFAPQYANKRPSERSLRVIETVSMGEKRSIGIIQAGNKRFLLACTPGQVTLLTELPEALSAADLDAPTGADVASALKFKNLYEMEKKSVPSRPAMRAEIPADIRGKMQQLRKALEG